MTKQLILKSRRRYNNQMDPVSIVGYTLSAVLIVLGIVLLIKSIRLKVNINLLFVVILCSAVGNLLAIAFGMIAALVGQILISIGFIALFLHYETIATRKPNMLITGILLMLFAMVVAFNILLIIFLSNYDQIELVNQNKQSFFFKIDDPVYKTAYILEVYFISIIALITFIRSFVVIFRAYLLSKSKPALVDSIGLGFLIIYRILFLPRYFLSVEQFMTISTIALGFSVVGLFMILVNYIVNPDYLYLLPFPIHSFMIYNNNGVLCYSRKVEQVQPEMEDKDLLISGAFSAISSLIQESLGADAKIQYIDAQQYQIYFNPLPKNSGTLVVIAYGETALFLRSLQRFTASISPTLLTSLNDVTIQTIFKQEIDTLIQKSYPYVNFAKKNREKFQ